MITIPLLTLFGMHPLVRPKAVVQFEFEVFTRRNLSVTASSSRRSGVDLRAVACRGDGVGRHCRTPDPWRLARQQLLCAGFCPGWLWSSGAWAGSFSDCDCGGRRELREFGRQAFGFKKEPWAARPGCGLQSLLTGGAAANGLLAEDTYGQTGLYFRRRKGRRRK